MTLKAHSIFIGCLLFISGGAAQARTVRSDLDLKFFQIKSYNQPPEYLGFTSSKVDNFVHVPSGDNWYVRPEGRLSPEDYTKLVNELHEKKFPGLDVSDRWDIKNQDLAALAGQDNLRILRVFNTRITDAGLSVLDELPGLKVLALNNQITNTGLRHVRGLKRLEALELNRSKITDAGLGVLKELPRLEKLDLSATRVTDAGAKTLASLLSLRQLDISGTSITDKGVSMLAGLPTLETLYVNEHVTNLGLKAIAGSKKLKDLDLSGAHITDAGVSYLTRADHLEALALSGTPIGDSALVQVAKLRNLKTLELSDTRITLEGLSALSGMPKLETVSLSWTELTATELEALGNLPHLSRVILNGRTLSPEVLSRIRALAKLHKPKPVQVASLEHHPMAGVAPAVHPSTVRSAPVPVKGRLRPGGDVINGASPSVEMTPAAIVKTPIGNEMTPKGKPMIIEVSARTSSGASSASHLTGLKRIYQAELIQGSHDPDLAPGESSQIEFPKETAENSLGEIEVGTSRPH